MRADMLDYKVPLEVEPTDAENGRKLSRVEDQ